MLADIPNTWLQTLSAMDIFKIIGVFFFLASVLFVVCMICAGLSDKGVEKRLLFVSTVVSSMVIGLFVYKNVDDWRYARSKGFTDLREHHFVIPTAMANSIFMLGSRNDELDTYGVSGEQSVHDISGDVHLLSTTKDFHYSTYFTVDGQNDEHGKPIVWRTSTVDLLSRYSSHLKESNCDKKNNEESSKSFENSHKLD